MKKILLTALTLAAVVVAAGAKSKAPKDPVLMTVDGVPVTLSEFEYLYNKNNDQQVDHQSLDEYLEMFKVYKLKVAEARHQHVDTAAAFRKEFEGYRAELAAPYLRDAETENKLVDEAYEHMKEQRRIAHIMLPLDKRSQADSLHRVLTATPGIFYSIAQFYSVDPSLKQNGGDYGWVGAGQFPYDFEEGVYNTPVGSVSDVITTDFGYHMVRVDEVRPNPGEIRASHILITGLSDESKSRIDSIYTLLQQGADFAETARSLSNCPSSAQGGDLGFF
ncbi:MAG: peptidyl-prolyl cis-trans isomerase, partial [Muribaculaceae bacterium]|nr:peptidyl-prolyl cis-trans isomerase [Muribaculaceae bacterium]